MKSFVIAVFVSAVLFFSIQGHVRGRSAMEKALTESGRAGITATGSQGLNLEFDLLDGVLTGYARSEEARDQALAAARKAIPAGRIINGVIVEANPPARLLAVFDHGELILSGVFPTGQAKPEFLDGLKEYGFALIRAEGLLLEPHVNQPGWLRYMPEFLANYFRGVAEGRLEIYRGGLHLRREIADEGERQEMVTRAELIWPDNGSLIDEMRLGPFVRATLRDDRLILSGRVPSERMRDSIGRAGALAGISNLSNQLRVDETVSSPRWGFAMGYFLGEFFRGAESGSVEFAPGIHRIEGIVAGEANQASLKEKAELLALGSGPVEVEVDGAKPDKSTPGRSSAAEASQSPVISGESPAK